MAIFNEYIENGFLRVGGSQSLGDGTTRTSTLYFQSMPGELGTSKAANYTPINILGRANPLQIYSNSGERSWNLELKFFVTEFDDSGAPQIDIDRAVQDTNERADATTKYEGDQVRVQVADKVNWCEALTYPIYRNNLSQGTAKIQFVFGDMINVNCICTSAQTSYPGPWSIKSKSLIGWPMYAVVNLTLTQIGGASISYRDVTNNLHNSPRAI